MQSPYNFQEAIEAANRIERQARNIGPGRPDNWPYYVLYTKRAMATHAQILMNQAMALITFADKLTPTTPIEKQEQLARDLDLADSEIHLEVHEYARIVQDWPGIATAGGHGYWPPVTPRQEGFQAGFNLCYSPNPYASGYQQLEWYRGQIAGEIARKEFEADLRGETCQGGEAGA